MALVEGDGMGHRKTIRLDHVEVTALPNGAVQIVLGRKVAEAIRTILHYIGGDPAGARGLVEKIATGLDRLNRLGSSTGGYLKESLIDKVRYNQEHRGLYFKDKRRG